MKRFVLRIFGVLFFVYIFIVSFLFVGKPPQTPDTQFGLTYSVTYARYLGLDVHELLQKIVTELRPTVVRLPLYWNEIEKSEGSYDFSEYRLFMDQLEETNTPVILTIGYKVPRYPECYAPSWTHTLSSHDFEERVRAYVGAAVTEFSSYENIEMWQVENEPFFYFGEACRSRSFEDIAKEVALVKRMDQRPVILTDSGELSSWYNAIALSDVFGTTVYRQVYNSVLGYITMPIRPIFYYRKSLIMRSLVNDVPLIDAELQMEPWIPDGVRNTSLELLQEKFTPDTFERNISYAKDTGITLHILWGVEYWYYLAQHGDDTLWEKALQLWN